MSIFGKIPISILFFLNFQIFLAHKTTGLWNLCSINFIFFSHIFWVQAISIKFGGGFFYWTLFWPHMKKTSLAGDVEQIPSIHTGYLPHNLWKYQTAPLNSPQKLGYLTKVTKCMLISSLLYKTSLFLSWILYWHIPRTFWRGVRKNWKGSMAPGGQSRWLHDSWGRRSSTYPILKPVQKAGKKPIPAIM